MIVFVSFDVQVHGLAFKTLGEVEQFRSQIAAAVRAIQTPKSRGKLEGDIVVELDLTAGEPEA